MEDLVNGFHSYIFMRILGKDEVIFLNSGMMTIDIGSYKLRRISFISSPFIARFKMMLKICMTFDSVIWMSWLVLLIVLVRIVSAWSSSGSILEKLIR